MAAKSKDATQSTTEPTQKDQKHGFFSGLFQKQTSNSEANNSSTKKPEEKQPDDKHPEKHSDKHPEKHPEKKDSSKDKKEQLQRHPDKLSERKNASKEMQEPTCSLRSMRESETQLESAKPLPCRGQSAESEEDLNEKLLHNIESLQNLQTLQNLQNFQILQYLQNLANNNELPEQLQQLIEELKTFLTKSKCNAPKSNTSKCNTPKSNASKCNAPKSNAPKCDAPKSNAPKCDAPKSNNSNEKCKKPKVDCNRSNDKSKENKACFPFNWFKPSPSPLVLYYDELNPQSRSVLMLINVLRIYVELRHVDLLKGQHCTETYTKLNPIQTVPTLVHCDLVLTDSHTILIYICEAFGGCHVKQLYPQCYRTRLDIFNKLFFEGMVLYKRHSLLLSEILCNDCINMEYHEKKVTQAYVTMNAFLEKSAYVVGASLTIADISIVTTVGSLDIMFPIEKQKERWPQLDVWFRRMRALSMYRFNIPGIQKQCDILQKTCGYCCRPQMLHCNSDLNVLIMEPACTLSGCEAESCCSDNDADEENDDDNCTVSESVSEISDVCEVYRK